MDGVVSASLFAVIDDIEAAFHLLCHDLGDRLAHRRLQFVAARTGMLFLGEQKLHNFRRARQTAGVSSKYAIHVRTRASPR
jgi:hypothetical protein